MSPRLGQVLLLGSLALLLLVLLVRAVEHARVVRRSSTLLAQPPGERRTSRPRRWLEAAVVEADLALEGERVARLWRLGLPVGAVLGFLLGGPVLAGFVLLLVGLAPAVGLHLARGRRRRRIDRSMGPVLEAVAAEVRAGRSLTQAVVVVADAPDGSGEAIAPLGAAVAAGLPLAEAVARWQRHAGGPSVPLVAAPLGLAARAGGTASRALDGVAATLHERHDADAEAHALAAQARLSALVIAVAPLGFACVAAATDPRVTRFLLGTPAGWLCVVGGLGLDLVSALWMRRIVATSSGAPA